MCTAVVHCKLVPRPHDVIILIVMGIGMCMEDKTDFRLKGNEPLPALSSLS